MFPDMNSIWQSLLDFVVEHLPHLDPFWGYLPLAVVIFLGALAVSYFFKPLLPAAGAVVLGTIAWLAGYRKSTSDHDKHPRT